MEAMWMGEPTSFDETYRALQGRKSMEERAPGVGQWQG